MPVTHEVARSKLVESAMIYTTLLIREVADENTYSFTGNVV
jgi:hypothetical protein